MTDSDIRQLAANGVFQGHPLQGQVEETHISWVILGRKNAFKIKKPLKLSFLDFSSLRLRKQGCAREVSLNRRFTNIYKGVLPVRRQDEQWFMGGETGKIADYAVQMDRLASSRRMDKMLEKGKVSAGNMQALAEVVATFHRSAKKINRGFELQTASRLFGDILETKQTVEDLVSPAAAEFLEKAIDHSNRFLEKHQQRLQQRVTLGFKRDLHGDLHSGNIFLYKNPVLFDCIEFDDSFRQIDVLYEIAFLCMDLEAAGMHRLVPPFLETYSARFPCFITKEDEAIFGYYKCLRANVRAKVHAVGAQQAGGREQLETHVSRLKKYLELMQSYFSMGALSV